MKLVPLTIKGANRVIGLWHRHNKTVVGGRFALGCEVNGVLVGVAIVARPKARMLDTDKAAEVTRLCVTPEAPMNAPSFLYGACRRVWQAMGGERLLTYTLQSESGASLRGAGWIPVRKFEGAQWSREDRPREYMAVCDESKIRWEAPNNSLEV